MSEKIWGVLKSFWIKLRRNRKLMIGLGVGFAGLLLVLFISRQTDIGTQKAATQLTQLGNNIRRFYQNKPDFWGLSTQTVIDKKIYPLKMLQNGRLESYFGNPVLIGKGEDAQILMPGARSFDIVYKQLNEKQCIELASFKFDEPFWLGITGITLSNGKQAQYFTWSDKENILPIQTNRAKELCRDNNTIIWHYE